MPSGPPHVPGTLSLPNALCASNCLPTFAFLSLRTFGLFFGSHGTRILFPFRTPSPHFHPNPQKCWKCHGINIHPTHTTALNQWLTPGLVNSEAVFCVLYWFPEFPSGLSSSCPQHTWLYNHPLLASFPSLSHLSAPLPAFPALHKINCLYLNTHVKVCFWGTQTKTDLLNNTCK